MWLALFAGGVLVGLLAAALRQRLRPGSFGRGEDLASVADEGLVRGLAVLRSAAMVVGIDGDVVRASQPAYALGLVRDDQLVHDAVRELVQLVRADGVIRDVELELPRGPVGSGQVILQIRVAPLDADGVLVLADDVTESHRLEITRRDFVVNVSHELKTPVGAITLLAEAVDDASDDPVAVKRFASRLTKEAFRLSSLVTDIIELSRLQSTSAMMDMERLDMADVIALAVDAQETIAAAKNIVVTVQSSPGMLVYGDRDVLVTAVRNLLDNAITYSPVNARVGVSLREVDGLVCVTVVDQGVGISAQDRERIFERFYRVDSARSREKGSTGLGLAIVKHVAAQHGGDVSVWSTPRAGSTFTLRLPAADAVGAVEQPAQGHREESEVRP